MTQFSVVFQMRGSAKVSPSMDVTAATPAAAMAKASAIIDAVTAERGDYAITVFGIRDGQTIVENFSNFEAEGE